MSAPLPLTVREELAEARERLDAKLEELYRRNFSICFEDNDAAILLAQSDLHFEPRYAEFLQKKAVRLEKDWEYIKLVTLRSLEPVVCVICLSTGEEMVAASILRCQHIFCLPCVVRQCLDSAAECSVCKKGICWKELKPVELCRGRVECDRVCDFVLVRVNLNTKERFDLAGGVPLSEVRGIGPAELERRVCADVDRLLSAAAEGDVDAQVAQVCEFIQRCALHDFVNCPPEFDRHAKRSCAADAGEKNSAFFYQLANRHNVFVHPVEFQSLRRGMAPPERISLRVRSLTRVCQTHTSRRAYKDFCHLPLGADFIIVSAQLSAYLSAGELQALGRAKQAADSSYRRRAEGVRRHNPAQRAPPAEAELAFPPLASVARKASTPDDFPALGVAPDAAGAEYLRQMEAEWGAARPPPPGTEPPPAAPVDFQVTKVKKKRKAR